MMFIETQLTRFLEDEELIKTVTKEEHEALKRISKNIAERKQIKEQEEAAEEKEVIKILDNQPIAAVREDRNFIILWRARKKDNCKPDWLDGYLCGMINGKRIERKRRKARQEQTNKEETKEPKQELKK